jgi:hypothetical protein
VTVASVAATLGLWKRREDVKRTQDHDGRHKLLLSNPQMVKDLLAFVDEPWVGELDFSTLKQAESSLLDWGQDGKPVRRETDLLWKVKTRGGQRIFVYLLIELQSTVDRSMPLRLLVYVAHLYHRLYWKTRSGGRMACCRWSCRSSCTMESESGRRRGTSWR